MIFVCVKGSWPFLSIDVIFGENNLAFYVMRAHLGALIIK